MSHLDARVDNHDEAQEKDKRAPKPPQQVLKPEYQIEYSDDNHAEDRGHKQPIPVLAEALHEPALLQQPPHQLNCLQQLALVNSELPTAP